MERSLGPSITPQSSGAKPLQADFFLAGAGRRTDFEARDGFTVDVLALVVMRVNAGIEAGYRRETASRRVQQNVIVLGGGEFEAGTQVVGLKKRIVGQDFLPAGTVGEQLQNIFHAQAITANAGTSAALAGFDRDP